MLTAAVTSYSNRMKEASGSDTTRARRNRTPRRGVSAHDGRPFRIGLLWEELARLPVEEPLVVRRVASRISRCTAELVVAAISSPNGGTLAIKRSRIIALIRAGSRTTDSLSATGLCCATLRQDLRVGDRPALEEEITSLLLDENR